MGWRAEAWWIWEEGLEVVKEEEAVGWWVMEKMAWWDGDGGLGSMVEGEYFSERDLLLVEVWC